MKIDHIGGIIRTENLPGISGTLVCQEGRDKARPIVRPPQEFRL
jgi:hypothetical protein